MRLANIFLVCVVAGNCYCQSPKDLRQRAEAGEAKAQLQWANQLLSQQLYPEAVKYFKLAARQQEPDAMYNVGAAYYNGWGVDTDDSLAFAWFRLAEIHGSKNGHAALSHVELSPGQRKHEDAVIGSLFEDPDQMGLHPEIAAQWYQRAAKRDDPAAIFRLSEMYYEGNGINQDRKLSVELLKRASALNMPKAQAILAYRYETADGTEQDFSKAAKLYEEAALGRFPFAMRRLGILYENGRGVKQSNVEAYKWLRLAADFHDTTGKVLSDTLQPGLTKKELKKANMEINQAIVSMNALSLRSK